MNRSHAQFILSSLVVTAIAAGFTACESDKKAKEPAPTPVAATAPAKPLSVEESARISTTSRVTAIDHTTRVLTLEDSSGRSTTLVAGDQVRRLNEVSVGDMVSADYVVSLLAELRPPTAEEAANPVSIVGIAGRAPQTSSPAAGAARGVRVVTTVQAVDQPSMMVTLRGPSGDTISVKGRKKENVAQLKVGDTIVITFTESIVVSLDKVAK